ncbi:hypothetical protein L1987_06315 [Smallanthus sonchifolius]|uniref:Uncharacterized protein n=1 Tax=Smallanthus sonchifolius TaxID=185202 RepID=A0ACB9JXU7_9ASTR|nr:hypothetical protein L1987_06315 [Smallanthus sonchifolius]
MVHLCVHLPQEAILGGPVQSRWMYPIERYLGHLKRYARNKAKPEGSIAEGYVVEEAITFCSHYLRGVESKLGKRDRNDDKTSSDARSFELDIFRLNGRGIGKKEVYILPSFLMNKAKWFIFNNCEEVQPYLGEHMQLLQRHHPESSDFSEMRQSTFLDWFAKGIRETYTLNPSQIKEELYALSCLPDNRANTELHLWDIPQDNNVEDLLEDVNLLREDIAEEIVENVDVRGSDGTVDDFIDDEIDNSDHSMEDFALKSNLDDSDTDKSANEIEDFESDDDDL